MQIKKQSIVKNIFYHLKMNLKLFIAKFTNDYDYELLAYYKGDAFANKVKKQIEERLQYFRNNNIKL